MLSTSNFLDLWESWPKRQVREWDYTIKSSPDKHSQLCKQKSFTAIGFAAELGQFKLIVFAKIGPLGGITEIVYIYDTNEPLEPHRLRLNGRSRFPDNYAFGVVLPLGNLRISGRMRAEEKRRAALDRCRRCVQELLVDIGGENQNLWITRIARIAETEPQSISTISGGSVSPR